jgi:hypothetical protein
MYFSLTCRFDGHRDLRCRSGTRRESHRSTGKDGDEIEAIKRSRSHSRYKSIIGDRLRARHPKSQEVEALMACNILSRMTELGRPQFFAIGA